MTLLAFGTAASVSRDVLALLVRGAVGDGPGLELLAHLDQAFTEAGQGVEHGGDRTLRNLVGGLVRHTDQATDIVCTEDVSHPVGRCAKLLPPLAKLACRRPHRLTGRS